MAGGGEWQDLIHLLAKMLLDQTYLFPIASCAMTTLIYLLN